MKRLTDKELNIVIAAVAEMGAGEFDETVYPDPEGTQVILEAALGKLVHERVARQEAKKLKPPRSRRAHKAHGDLSWQKYFR